MKRLLIVLITAALLLAGCATKAPDASPELSVAVITNPPLITSGSGIDSSNSKNTDIVNPNRTYSYEMMFADSKALKAAHPGLIETDVIGKSVEGRDILLIKLGRGDNKIAFAGAHHAREYITSTYLMETIDEYARSYESGEAYGGFNIKALLDEATIYIVPMVNPDGVNLVQNGVESVKDPEKVKSMRMMQHGYSEWKANINGVDLNRQYPCHWEEKASNTDVPSSEMYKGEAPATEPEVKAMMKLCEENDFLLAASFHSKGEVIYWADSGTEDEIPAAQQIAQTLSDVTGYALNPVSEDPAVYGAGFENWFRQEFKRPAFCIELTPAGNGAAPHNDEEFQTLIWDKAKYLCADLVHQALETD
jgi:hypothetical protein